MAYYAIDKSVTANELRFHYRDWDGHGWPTLLLHGLASTSHVWDLVAPLLEDSSRTIALDLHGHGRSDKPDGDYTFTRIGTDLVDVLDAIHFEHPVIAGHDWGAHVALSLAADHPDRPGGLILVDGGIVDHGTSLSWDEMQKRIAPPRVSDLSVDAFREQLVSGAPQGLISPAVEAAILASFEIDSDHRLHPRLPAECQKRILRALWEQRLSDLYERVTCPTLILAARPAGTVEGPLLEQKEQGVSRRGTDPRCRGRLDRSGYSRSAAPAPAPDRRGDPALHQGSPVGPRSAACAPARPDDQTCPRDQADHPSEQPDELPRHWAAGQDASPLQNPHQPRQYEQDA
jgi:pimeloyl-ACP methyl ester carboxylesterase